MEGSNFCGLSTGGPSEWYQVCYTKTPLYKNGVLGVCSQHWRVKCAQWVDTEVLQQQLEGECII